MSKEVNTIVCGDCLEVMKDWPDNSFDGIVTDPPYGLGFMSKDWDTFKDAQKSQRVGEFYTTRNIGGQIVKHTKGWSAASDAGSYDHSRNAEFQQWFTIWATKALRIVKPGAIMLIFGGTRTYHRLTCAIEDAGWQIRDCMMWLYGSGFPKSLNISKAIDKAVGAKRKTQKLQKSDMYGDYQENRKRKGVTKTFNVGSTKTIKTRDPFTNSTTDLAKLWDGYGTALKPAWEPIIVVMKPLDGTFAHNAEKWGVAGLNIDGARIGTEQITINRHGGYNSFSLVESTKGKWQGKQKQVQGRWPANLILDEEAAAMLDEQTGTLKTKGHWPDCKMTGFGKFGGGKVEYKGTGPKAQDSGGASRFFYCAKASRAERNAGLTGYDATLFSKAEKGTPEKEGLLPHAMGGSKHRIRADGKIESVTGKWHSQNHHPTVKPLALMEYLCKLLKPPTENPILLDPFTGSGTTLMAAINTGWDYVGIEKEKDYCEIAEKRVAYVKEQRQGQMALFEKGD